MDGRVLMVAAQRIQTVRSELSSPTSASARSVDVRVTVADRAARPSGSVVPIQVEVRGPTGRLAAATRCVQHGLVHAVQ